MKLITDFYRSPNNNNMKTRFISTLAFVVLAYGASAQKTELSKVLSKDEVPVVVVQTLQKDFTNLTEKGTWKMFYIEDVRTTKLTPEFYEYSCKKDGEKIELYFKPDGTLDHAKGMNAQTPSHTSQP